MNLRDPIIKSLVLFSCAFLIVFGFSFVKNFFIGTYHAKNYNLFSDLLVTPSPHDKIALKKILKQDSIVVVKDSLQALEDSLLAYDLKIIDFGNDSTGLQKFNASLCETAGHRKRTRIAYFGDSQVEGDLVTSELRALLQGKFGGKGVGFVPITSVVAGFFL